MGFDYALVHLKYTIPPSIALTVFYYPLISRTDRYKVGLLIAIAVISTIPWDSYLIRNNIWTYPATAVLGPSLFQIPVEELFFFVIQTYATSLVYLCLNKSVFHPACLPCDDSRRGTPSFSHKYDGLLGVLGQSLLVCSIVGGLQLVRNGGPATYLGLILSWASPFLLFLWTLTYRFLARLPSSSVAAPIALPTIYLWCIDTFALQRGTWVIVAGTKLDVHLWKGLEVEEALFFLVTNCMVVLGLVAFDNAMAIVQTFPSAFRVQSTLPSPIRALRILLSSSNTFGQNRIQALRESIDILKQKSRSFYLASSAFEGSLRIDLVLLYSFCRIADDLVDNAPSVHIAKSWIAKLRQFLSLAYAGGETVACKDFVTSNFPLNCVHPLLELPVDRLSQKPLLELLRGFEVDLEFSAEDTENKSGWPIQNQADLLRYGGYVAGTIAELCLDLVAHHYPDRLSEKELVTIRNSAVEVGQALQTVNIARDISVDAANGRVYIPVDWLDETSLSPVNVLRHPNDTNVVKLRSRLLDLADSLYNPASQSIKVLPREVRGPMTVAVESYMEIGKVLKQQGYQVKHGRATVNISRRLWVAWRALYRN